jgi:hypothetical protein
MTRKALKEISPDAKLRCFEEACRLAVPGELAGETVRRAKGLLRYFVDTTA